MFTGVGHVHDISNPPSREQTDACENITFPQLPLRAVINMSTHNTAANCRSAHPPSLQEKTLFVTCQQVWPVTCIKY